MTQIKHVYPSITGAARLVGVIGYPVEHSLSPPMQNAALSAAGLDAIYVPMAVHPSDLKTAVAGLKAAGFVGINVTIPHKVAAFQLADELAGSAKLVGAVNTLHFKEGKTFGYNTDGDGFLKSLSAAGSPPEGLTVTVLGAGGAARSIALHLALAGVNLVLIANRTLSKAVELAEEINAVMGDRGRQFAKAVPWEDSALAESLRQSQLVVNATPVGMSSYAPDSSPVRVEWLHPELTVYDTVYSPFETRLLAEAKQCRCRAVSGAEMLVMQGAEAFRIWFGREPDIEAMRDILISHLLNR